MMEKVAREGEVRTDKRIAEYVGITGISPFRIGLIKMASLKQEAERFLQRRMNPVTPVKEASEFLRQLDKSGELKTRSESEWVDVGRTVFDLTDEEITPWMNNAAGWIVDTSNDPGGIEPAAWAHKEIGKSRSNPSRKGRGGCAVCIPDCPCGCVDCQICDSCVYCGCCCIC